MPDYADMERGQSTASHSTARDGLREQLGRQLDRLSNSLDRLESAIEPVLSPPSPEAALAPAMPFQSQLANDVSRLSDRLDRLDSLTNRIEL